MESARRMLLVDDHADGLAIISRRIRSEFPSAAVVEVQARGQLDVARALEAAESRYRELFDRVPIGLYRFDSRGRFLAVNPALVGALGYPDESSLLAVNAQDLFADAEDFRRWELTIEQEGRVRGLEVLIRRGDGAVIWGRLTTQVVRDENGEASGYEGSLEDVTQGRWQEEWFTYATTHDTTTGLPNRRSLEKAIRRALAGVRAGEQEAAALLLDVDRFNVINEAVGHTSGDLVLVSIGRRLLERLRPEDLLARVGGDEFMVLLEGVGVEYALDVAETLRQTIDEFDIHLEGNRLGVGASVSLVQLRDQETPEVVLSQADAAVHRAKELGRNRVVCFDPELDDLSRLSESSGLVVRLREALRGDGFEFHFQPAVRLDTGEVHHYEALLRLRGENGELVGPSRFIPVVERFGLMPQLTSWVVRQIVETLRENPDVRIFLNMPGQRLGDASLLQLIERCLGECGVEPRRLGFEITEATAVRDLDLADRWIRHLKGLGCRFALDDFGSGFSSFAALRKLPVDQLNVDGSVVRSLATDPIQRAIVQAIRTLGETMRMEVVAEFVESEEVAQALLQLGVVYGQGYHLGRPSPRLA